MRETLGQEISRRLADAGFAADSPEIVWIREHNRQAMTEGRLCVELRRGQFGQTRRVRLADLDVSGGDSPRQ